MSESKSNAIPALKVGAVALSLALMGGYVWHRSSGSPAAAESNAAPAAREMMSGSKSEMVFVPRREGGSVDNSGPELVVEAAPPEKAARKELMFSSKSGKIFVPEPAATVKPADPSLESNYPSNTKADRVVIELTPEQQAAIAKAIMLSKSGGELKPEELKALMELQEATKKLAKNPSTPASTEPKPDTTERRTAQERSVPVVPSVERSYVIEQPRSGTSPANPPPAQPRRRVLMPGSKSMVLPSDRVYVVPAPKQQQAQSQSRGF